MPIPPYSKVLIQLNGGSAASGAITAAHGDVVRMRLEDSSHVRTARWEIWEYPAGFTVPAGYLTDANTGAYYYLGVTPPDWTLPASTALWGRYFTRCTVTPRSPGLVPDAQLVDESTALKILSPNGIDDVGHLETNQFDPQRWWIGSIKGTLRILEAFIAGGGGGGAVTSVFGRPGDVVAVAGDYSASEVDDDSSLATANVAAALDALDAAINVVASSLLTPPADPADDTKVITALAGDLNPVDVYIDGTTLDANARDIITAGEGNFWAGVSMNAHVLGQIDAGEVILGDTANSGSLWARVADGETFAWQINDLTHLTLNQATGLSILQGGDFRLTGGIFHGSAPASVGALRVTHGFTAYSNNNAESANVALWDFGATTADRLCAGNFYSQLGRRRHDAEPGAQRRPRPLIPTARARARG